MSSKLTYVDRWTQSVIIKKSLFPLCWKRKTIIPTGSFSTSPSSCAVVAELTEVSGVNQPHLNRIPSASVTGTTWTTFELRERPKTPPITHRRREKRSLLQSLAKLKTSSDFLEDQAPAQDTSSVPPGRFQWAHQRLYMVQSQREPISMEKALFKISSSE